MHAFPILLGLAAALLPGAALADDLAARCDALTRHRQDDLRITAATLVGASAALPRHCQVQADFERRTGVDGVPYAIRMELRLPAEWNGRLVFQGGGGMNGYVAPAYGGNINSQSVHPGALARGFAVVSTDTGHVAKHGADASFARDQQAKLNYAYAAIGKVAQHAKGLAAALGGRAPERSYFLGCSNGGREGMLMAQRYPTLFDGVLAANPAFNLRDAAVLSYATGKAYDEAARKDGAGAAARLVSPREGALIRGALLDKCDALDGARDGMIFDHAACSFDVRALSCRPGQRADACLAPAKAEAIARAFEGPVDGAGQPRFTPWTWDASVFTPEWLVWQTGSPRADGGVDTGLRDLVTSSLTQLFAFPAIDPDSLGGGSQDIERLMRSSDVMAGMMAATSTDLTSFAARGGKLMLIDGWSDPIFSANDLVRWHARMAADMEQASGKPAADFARLYMVPGMAHCAGGQALDDMDGLGALVDWVERGVAPAFLKATGRAFPGVSRPICAWPEIARYQGSGPLDDAASFACKR
jgi:feruloyl esterase